MTLNLTKNLYADITNEKGGNKIDESIAAYNFFL